MKISRIAAIVVPGLLVAATGVGMGDLAGAGFAGIELGTAILWAVVVGAVLKFIVTEGIARWQLATGSTVLQGATRHLGPWPMRIFLPYLLLWTFVTCAALMAGCGIALNSLVPVFDDPDHGKAAFGIVASIIGIALVRFGGFDIFEKVMTACIVLMFITVTVTAILLWPGGEAFLSGLLVPKIPDAGGSGVTWTVAVIGGVGGTVTILSYGYWIRESGREGKDEMPVCRIDLATAYSVTALVGMSVVIIGSTVEVGGSGATLVVAMADALESQLGEVGRWLFLLGAVGAVFSSLLGVWQATPYFFSDAWHLLRGSDAATDTKSEIYRGYLYFLGTVPMLGLFIDFRQAFKLHAVIGAFFVPMLALVLLLMNSRAAWIGDELRNRPVAMISLSLIVAFFSWIAYDRIFG